MWARARMMAMRQRLSLPAVGFLFGDFIPLEIAVAEADCESAPSPFRNQTRPPWAASDLSNRHPL
jgi:hypothetical protein